MLKIRCRSGSSNSYPTAPSKRNECGDRIFTHKPPYRLSFYNVTRTVPSSRPRTAQNSVMRFVFMMIIFFYPTRPRHTPSRVYLSRRRNFISPGHSRGHTIPRGHEYFTRIPALRQRPVARSLRRAPVSFRTCKIFKNHLLPLVIYSQRVRAAVDSDRSCQLYRSNYVRFNCGPTR